MFVPKKRREKLDNTPVAIPVRFRTPPTPFEQARQMLRADLSALARDQGFETFDEANDFDIDDDPVDYSSPWEIPQDHEDHVQSVRNAYQRRSSPREDPPKPKRGERSPKAAAPAEDPPEEG